MQTWLELLVEIAYIQCWESMENVLKFTSFVIKIDKF